MNELADLESGLCNQIKVLQAIGKVENWSNSTQTVSGDPSISAARDAAMSYYTQQSANFKDRVNKTREAIKAGAGEDAERATQIRQGKLFDSLATMAMLINPRVATRYGSGENSGGSSGGSSGGELVQNLFRIEEQQRDVLFFALPANEDPQKVMADLVQEYTNAAKTANNGNYYGGSSTNSAYMILREMRQNQQLQGPTYRKVMDFLGKSEAPDHLMTRLQAITARVNAGTATSLSPDEVNGLLETFKYGENPLVRQASPEASLKMIQKVLTQAMPSFKEGEIDVFSHSSGLHSLRKDIDQLIELSNRATDPDATDEEI